MPNEPEFWGGELRVPRWLRRNRKTPSADDTPERQRELRNTTKRRRAKPIPEEPPRICWARTQSSSRLTNAEPASATAVVRAGGFGAAE